MDEMKSLGKHLILELWECQELNSMHLVEQALRESAQACNAKLLNLTIHPFSPIGITGVAVLSKSHILIHTWPELGFAAVDVFICEEDIEPAVVLPIFQRYFNPASVQAMEVKRGVSRE
jgi:S-adenosylmethionine decarboxylase